MMRSGPLIALCVVLAFAALAAAQTSNATTNATNDDPYKIKAYQARVNETEVANDIAQTTAQRYAAHKIFIRRRISNLIDIAGRLQNKLQKAPETERAKLASTLGRVKQRITALRSHFQKFRSLEMKAEVAAKEAFDVLHNYITLVKNATKVQRRDNWLARSGAIAKTIEKVAPIDPKPDHPEQVHLQLAGQRRFPIQKMVVNWVTGVPPAGYQHESVVQWSLSRHAMSVGSRLSPGRSHVFTDGGVERRNISIHSALIDGLDAETRYYYRVGVRLVPFTNTTATATKLGFVVNQWQYSNVFHFQTFPKLRRAKLPRRSFAQKNIASVQSQARHSARSVKDQASALSDSIDEMFKGAFKKLSVGNKELDERLARKRARILREMKRDQREIDEVMGLIPRGSFLEEQEDIEAPQEEDQELSVEEEAERELSLLQVSEESDDEEEEGSDDAPEDEGADENTESSEVSEETENTDGESSEESSTSTENAEDILDNSVPKLTVNEAVDARRQAVLSQEEALKQPPKGFDVQSEFPTVFRGPPNQYRAMPESLKKKLKLKKTMLRKLKQLRKDLAKSDAEEKARLQRLYRKLKRSYKTLFKKEPKAPQWQARPLSGQPFTARTPVSTTKAAIDVQKSKFGPKSASKHRFGAVQVPPPMPRLPNDPPKPIEIAVYGDMGVQLNPTIKKLYAEIHSRELDMVIHTGDYAYDMHDDSGRLGDTFMNMIEPIAAYVPYMTCTGNHEYPYNYSHYTERFWGLSDYADSGNNHFYSFDVGTVHFVAFNSDAYLHPQLSDLVKRQYEWLEADLARANRRRSLTPFIVLFAHHPMYCSNTQDINECTTQALLFRRGLNGSLYSLEDLLVKHNVDLYISAHEHSYERTYPVYNGKIDTEGQITPSVYRNARFPAHIVAGAAGDIELLDLFDEVWFGPWSVTRSTSYGYGHLTVHNHTHLQWRQFLDEGRGGVDEVWIVKDADWPGMDKSVLAPTHPFSPQTRTCDHYCYATCMGRLKKTDPEQINVRRITECVPQCNCQPEARKGMIDVLGQDIVSRRDKIVVK